MMWKPLESGQGISDSSDAYVKLIAKVVEDEGAVLALRTFTTPIYLVDSSTPLHDISLSASWAPAKSLRGVPVPDGALADPEDDGNFALIDTERGCEWDVWQAKHNSNGWSATWANAIDTSGDGVFPHGMSSRGSGFALSLGLIWPDEIKSGHIDHVVVFSYPFTSSAGSVGASTESDGWSDRPDALPEGALLRFDPTLDIDSLGLPAWQTTIAHAIQDYGMLLIDDGGGVQLYGVHSWSSVEDPWARVFDDRAEYESLDALPFDRLQVIDFGEPVDREVKFVPGRCADFDALAEE